MTVYKLRGYYLLLEEKDRKIFRNPGVSSPKCIVSYCSSWLAIRLSQETLPCLGARDSSLTEAVSDAGGSPARPLFQPALGNNSGVQENLKEEL